MKIFKPGDQVKAINGGVKAYDLKLGQILTVQRYNRANENYIVLKENAYHFPQEWFEPVVPSKSPEDWL